MKSPIEKFLEDVHHDTLKINGGKLASYIPELATMNPDLFGIALATVDGYVYETGDTRTNFSIQSISKPFTYALALDDIGFEAVDEKIDVEPSGDSFNEISLEPGTGRPMNPMINAGAIAAVSLVRGGTNGSRPTRILNAYSSYAGRDLDVDDDIFTSELVNGHRNRAIGHMLRNFGILETDPNPVLKDYFMQCSVNVDCRDLAMMAATLANNGVNPVTEQRVMEVDVVERVLSVMTTCGMYDAAGEWVTSVGMPAKSGVGGGIIAVLPGQVGLAVFAPPLDDFGHSVRGMSACERISRELELHFVRAGRTGRSTVRSSYPITNAPSGIRRNDESAEVLEEHGHRAEVLELQGDLLFAGAEAMVRAVTALPTEVEHVVLDIRRVDEVAEISLRMFMSTWQELTNENRSLLLVDPESKVASYLESELEHDKSPVPVFDTRSGAVEWCESTLISRYGNELCRPSKVEARNSPALGTMSDDDAKALQELMVERTYDDGDIIRRVGQKFGGVHFIESGTVAGFLRAPSGDRVQTAKLSAGMTFGELALGSEDRQETTVKAAGKVSIKLLEAATIDTLEEDNPRLSVALWKALTRDAYVRVDQQLREMAVRTRD